MNKQRLKEKKYRGNITKLSGDRRLVLQAGWFLHSPQKKDFAWRAIEEYQNAVERGQIRSR